MALRLLVFRLLEMRSQFNSKKTHFGPAESKSKWKISLALFTGIVDIVRQFCTDLQFACLFVEVGRQIEPSLLAHLFPLPISISTSQRPPLLAISTDGSLAGAHVAGRYNARTVTELFHLYVHAGSLQASSSCLPLLSSPDLSQQYMCSLLEGALRALIDDGTDPKDSFDHTVEERRVMGDLFRFGVRMEDATQVNNGELENGYENGVHGEKVNGTLSEPSSIVACNSYGSAYGSAHGSTHGSSHGRQVDVRRSSLASLVCAGGVQNGSLMSVLGSMLDGKRNSQSEEAIRRAASSFIGSKHELLSMDLLNLSFDDESQESFSQDIDRDDASDSSSESSSTTPEESIRKKSQPSAKGVATIVRQAILKVFQRNRKTGQHWSTMGVLARILIQSSAPVTSFSVLRAAILDLEQTKIEAFLRQVDDAPEYTDKSILEKVLAAEIMACDSQLRVTQDSTWIADLSLFLLDRVAGGSDGQSDVMAALVLTGVVAICCSGRAGRLLELLGESNFITRALKAAMLE